MTAVPKLNYANLRGKSKSKDSEFSDRKIENNSSDLFSHMNQDNLKYIQNQIKQKNKRGNQITLKKKSEQAADVSYDNRYPEKIQEKQSKYQETERQQNQIQIDPHTKILKTEGESIKLSRNNQFEGPSKKVSQEAQTNKLSYYDLVSQAKSKRVSSIQAYYEQENQGFTNSKQTGAFINFLSGYIQDLNKEKKEKKKINMSKNQTQNEKQREKINTNTISSPSDIEIIKSSLAEEKIRNSCLAKQLQQSRMQKQNTSKRLQNIEKYVVRLDQQVRQLRTMVNNSKKSQVHKSQLQNMNIYENRIDTSHLSHRKNLTSFSLISNDARNYRKKEAQAQAQLKQLQKQFNLFKETGQCSLNFKKKVIQYD